MAKTPQQLGLRKNNTSVFEVKTERDTKHAFLKDFKSGQRVTFEWGRNTAMTRDGMFKITIGDRSAILNAEELRRYLRWC